MERSASAHPDDGVLQELHGLHRGFEDAVVHQREQVRRKHRHSDEGDQVVVVGRRRAQDDTGRGHARERGGDEGHDQQPSADGPPTGGGKVDDAQLCGELRGRGLDEQLRAVVNSVTPDTHTIRYA